MKGRYVCEMQELMFILPAHEQKENDKAGEMSVASLPLTVNSKSPRAKSLSVLVLDTS